jgi:NMD protein affecting ribosome stability and mRNA decay
MSKHHCWYFTLVEITDVIEVDRCNECGQIWYRNRKSLNRYRTVQEAMNNGKVQ